MFIPQLPFSIFLVLLATQGRYFYWPRVQVVLSGIQELLKHDWDFVIYLSESDYPLHSMAWIPLELGAAAPDKFHKDLPKVRARGQQRPASQQLALVGGHQGSG